MESRSLTCEDRATLNPRLNFGSLNFGDARALTCEDRATLNPLLNFGSLNFGDARALSEDRATP